MCLSTSTGPSSESLQGRNPRDVGRKGCRALYGDFEAVVEDEVADEVAGGAIAERRSDENKARIARQLELDADVGFVGCRLGRALPWPAVGQQHRSAQQQGVRLPGLMRCRS
jgi:hypothetical protein